MSFFSDLMQEALNSAANLSELLRGKGLRLGVTGLSRAGKTVFITALARQLTQLAGPGEKIPCRCFGSRLKAGSSAGDWSRSPTTISPRFNYEDHVAALTGPDRHWPQSTRQISELRLRVDYMRRDGFRSGPSHLHIDIVDYPGEWLLDLPLMRKSYADWSRETFEASAGAARAPLAADWRGFAATLDPAAPRRGSGPSRRRDVHRLSARRARRRLRALDPAAGPLPDAGRSRRLAGPDLCAPCRSPEGVRSRRHARGDDGAALRGL